MQSVKTHFRYNIRKKGESGVYCSSGWSQYYTRLKMFLDNKILEDEIYGPQQCREHIQELRESVYEGKRIHENDVFEIVRTIVIEDTFDEVIPVKTDNIDCQFSAN